jgi:hypothetical protein
VVDSLGCRFVATAPMSSATTAAAASLVGDVVAVWFDLVVRA